MPMAFRGFGRTPSTYGTPPYVPAPGDEQGAGVLPAGPKPGFFSRGGGIADIVGGIADGVIAANGGRAVYQPMQQQRLQRQQQLEDYERTRTDQYGLWEAQQAYKAAHPDTPDIVDRMHALDGVEPGLGATYARNYASNGGGGMQIITTPQGTFGVPKGGGMAPAAPAGPAPGAIEGGYRFKGGNPSDPNAWEPATGGPASQAPATFR